MSLKEDGPVATDIRPLLGPALDGLAKFSHLISVDFMADLLAVLRTLAAGGHIVTGTQSDNLLSVGERLQCCIIAFKIVRSNMDALNIDLREFYVRLYNLLFEFNSVRYHLLYFTQDGCCPVMSDEDRSSLLKSVSYFLMGCWFLEGRIRV